MARYRVLTWNGIPSAVRAEDAAGGRVKRELPDWFAQEIDRVAMRDGLVGSDAYMEAWSWSKPVERDGTAAEVVDAVVGELVDEWGRRAEG
jgi:hypothetical protein